MAEGRLVGRRMATPLGALPAVASEAGLVAVLWDDDRAGRVPLGLVEPDDGNAHLAALERQLAAYFDGRLRQFDVTLDLRGTPFQREVWGALAAIGFGETRSYSEIAQALGRPEAVRAVGAAVGRNPVSIVVPCHRVLGANGTLTGFAGGLDAKGRLLALEGVTIV